MDSYCDPFGFNKQTATLLRGLGVSELIPTCKERNISTDVLHGLSIEELMMLGLNYKKAEELHKTLNIKKKRCAVAITNNEDRIQHFLDILKQGENQFSLIQAFVAYCRLRLTKERIDIFIDPNKCLSASEILPISVRATLTEIQDAKKSLTELQQLILELKVKPKHSRIRPVYAFISGLGIVTLILFKVCLH